MTADVNFTDLARAGEAAGLKVVHFGPERDLVGDDLPEMLRAAAEQESVAEFLGNPVFKVLVLGKRAERRLRGAAGDAACRFRAGSRTSRSRAGGGSRRSGSAWLSLATPLPDPLPAARGEGIGSRDHLGRTGNGLARFFSAISLVFLFFVGRDKKRPDRG